MTRHPLAIAMTVALGMLVIAPIAEAQQQAGGTSMREQRAKRMAELGKGKEEARQEEQKPAKYPNATRVAPEAKANPKAVRNLQALQDAYEKQDMAGVIAKSEEIAAMPNAGAYEKSFAYSMAGNAAADLDDQAKAADYFAKAVESNGLDNDSHFNTMYNLAVIQFGNEKYALHWRRWTASSPKPGRTSRNTRASVPASSPASAATRKRQRSTRTWSPRTRPTSGS